MKQYNKIEIIQETWKVVHIQGEQEINRHRSEENSDVKLSDNDFEIVKKIFFHVDMMNEQREISAKKLKLLVFFLKDWTEIIEM